MSEVSLTLRRVDDGTLSYVENLLKRNNLPWEDVNSKTECFYIGYRGNEPVGVGGIEVYDSDGLLRSVVVEESFRGDGFGKEICDALEAQARYEGVETVYLLTTTASDFFADRGYVEIERSEAPDTIQKTTEFDDLCPESATCMRKSL